MIEINDDGKSVKRHKCISLLEKKHDSQEEMLEYLKKRDEINKMIIASGISNYGEAIGYIEYVEEGNFWVAHCDEYTTIIKYCPFCGEKLK